MFTDNQPKDGDVILHCGHMEAKPHHFFMPLGNLKFMRPDKTFGEAKWLVCCDQCFKEKGKDFDVRGDGTWIGDEPEIKVNPIVN